MTQPQLQRARIVAIIGQLESAGVGIENDTLSSIGMK
jgi:hypothetical protein